MPTKISAAALGLTTGAPTIAGNLPKGFQPVSSIAEAEFLALPRPGERCRFSNLSRTTLCELLARGDIKGVTIRKPGAVRGKRLIVKQSLADFLHGLTDTASSDKAATNNPE